MRILYVITRSDVMGGASVHLLDLAEGIQDMGHDVAILVGGNGVFLDKALSRGIACTSLKNMFRELRPISDVKCFFEVRRRIKTYSPDLVHLHSSKAGILGRMAAVSLGVPSVFTAHGWAFTEGVSSLKRFFYKYIERFMSSLCGRVIAVSEYDRQLAVDLSVVTANKIVAIHNGIPDIPPVHKESGAACHMIMVARFEEPKDHASLINALAQLQDLDWTLELVGDGPLLNEIKNRCSELGLIGRVSFPGARSDVQDRLARSDLFVLLSKWEGFPLTILEAMRAGLPVIASNVGGVSEAVCSGQTGYLVGRDDPEALVIYMRLLLTNSKLRDEMGAAGRASFSKRFQFSTMLEKTNNVYREIIN